MYKYLFILFIGICIYFIIRRTDSKPVATMMALVLFALVAFRAITVGPDTKGYLLYYFYHISEDTREIEPFFRIWNEYLLSIGVGAQMYLIINAVFSIGLILLTFVKKSPNAVLSVTLLLACFEWSFFLTGLRQSLAMGFISVAEIGRAHV